MDVAEELMRSSDARRPANESWRAISPLGEQRRLLVLGAAALVLAAGAAAGDPDNCLYCHQFRGLGRWDAGEKTAHLFYVDPEYYTAGLGPHSRLACTDCHERSEVEVIPHKPVSPVNCAQTCHLSGPNEVERRFSHQNVADMLESSQHSSETLTDLTYREGALLRPGQSRCLYCHDEPLFRDPTGAVPVLDLLGGRTYDRCDVCHRDQAPADIGYYLRHMASRLQPARPPLEMAQVCAVCHSDPTVLAAHGMHDAVASFALSFHGKAAVLGNDNTPTCVSCHVGSGENAHLMLPPSDPRSAVSPQRVADSCRALACHPGADPSIAASAVHLELLSEPALLEFCVVAAFIALTIFSFGPSMLICVLELFGLLIGRKHHHAERAERLVAKLLDHPRGRRRLVRFTLSQRFQHWILVILFTALALTGFPMKFADRAWARYVIEQFGGLDVARLVHHWAGLALVVGFAVHIAYVIATTWRRCRAARRRGEPPLGCVGTILSLPMWIGPTDARKFGQLLMYLMFLRRQPPTFGRFTVKEKFEYLGVFWGTTLLGITGAMLWGEQLTSRLLGGRVFNIAIIAHSFEAFLAIIHVGILHIVNVMLSPNVFPLSPATLTGATPAVELAENHSEFVQQVADELGVRVEEEDDG
ncbi:MAG: hypothetical protein D6744_01245 [Planctomycetota bacterium]|nr:MAG: hypothetical protein D6744_01245 [Planctomycetota bacterium]